MNEIELKYKFIQFLKDKHTNEDILISNNKNITKLFEIKNEALGKKFDLLIALVKTSKIKQCNIKTKTIEIDDNLKNIFTRNYLLKEISNKYKINILDLTIYPIEIKSDKDNLNERLANQIIDAILIFGRSILVLGEKHSSKIIKSGLGKILPSTIIGYNNKDQKFFLINRYSRVYSDSLLNISKKSLLRTLKRSNIAVNHSKLYRNLKNFQAINQKLIFNQIFNTEEFLFEQELKFIESFSQLDIHPLSVKKEIIKSINETKNHKLTEFIE